MELAALILLWSTAVVLSLVALSACIIAFTDRDAKVPHPANDVDASTIARRLLYLTLCTALIVAGRPALAALFISVPVIGATLRAHARVRTGLSPQSPPNPVWRAFQVADRLMGRAVWSVLSGPVTFAIAAWRRSSEIRECRALRRSFGDPEVLIYLLYAEQHQFDRFLGSDGVLHPFAGQVIARDWRRQIMPVRSAAGEDRFRRSSEGLLVHRFGLTSMREHLPFIVVADAENRLTPFHCNRAYRRRRRDKGVALHAVERQVHRRIAEAIAAATA
ncbi:MAG: hypothetical protein V3R98_11725 [Alphaproteobacteria bacterium]